jgi:hypothetical protein
MHCYSLLDIPLPRYSPLEGFGEKFTQEKRIDDPGHKLTVFGQSLVFSEERKTWHHACSRDPSNTRSLSVRV